MFDKKNYVLNCDICDARKMKEEDYNNYKNMIINADIVIVSTSSKSILNRLPVTINQDYTIEIADDVETELKVINGSYEITDSMVVQEHTLLIVNGALNIHSGTKEILEKYEKIHVNGSVRCAESISGYLTKLSASNSVSIYPDDCMILNDTFIVDKYFPLSESAIRNYELGNRFPSSEQLEKIANSLKISPYAMSDPNFDTYVSVMHALFALEDQYGLHAYRDESGVPQLMFKDKGHDSLNMLDHIGTWADMYQKFRNEEITEKEYLDWKSQFPAK